MCNTAQVEANLVRAELITTQQAQAVYKNQLKSLTLLFLREQQKHSRMRMRLEYLVAPRGADHAHSINACDLIRALRP